MEKILTAVSRSDFTFGQNRKWLCPQKPTALKDAASANHYKTTLLGLVVMVMVMMMVTVMVTVMVMVMVMVMKPGHNHMLVRKMLGEQK